MTNPKNVITNKTPAKWEVESPDAYLSILLKGLRHEMGNILTPIVAFGEMLAEQDGIEDEMLEINKASEKAVRLMDKLNVISGSFVPERQKITLLDLAETFEQNWKEEAGLSIKLAIDEGKKIVANQADTVVEVDVKLLLKAFDELGKNCTEAGSADVYLSIGIDKGNIILRVQDDGNSINPELLTEVADLYFTTSTLTTKGLGLSFVNGVTYIHGGKLFLEIPPGRSGFVVEMQIPTHSTTEHTFIPTPVV